MCRSLFCFFSFSLLITHSLAYTPTTIPIFPLHRCPINGQVPCGSGLPSDFCCSSGETCLKLAGNTTAICCPAGKDCSIILPISCDIQRQNVTSFPDSPVKTNAFRTKLMRCANLCCPFGYTCDSENYCVENVDQSILPNMSLPLLFPPKETSPPISCPSPASMNIPMPVATKVKGRFPPTAIVTGFFPGLIIGALLTAGIQYFRNGSNQDNKWQRSRSIPHVISAPQPIIGERSDFLGTNISPNVVREIDFTPSGKLSPFSEMASKFRNPPRFDYNDSDIDEVLKTPLPPVPLNIRKEMPPF